MNIFFCFTFPFDYPMAKNQESKSTIFEVHPHLIIIMFDPFQYALDVMALSLRRLVANRKLIMQRQVSAVVCISYIVSTIGVE